MEFDASYEKKRRRAVSNEDGLTTSNTFILHTNIISFYFIQIIAIVACNPRDQPQTSTGGGHNLRDAARKGGCVT